MHTMERLKGKQVVVTGGAGFLGSHLVEMLVASGAVVKVVDNLQNGSVENLREVIDDIVFVEADLRNYKHHLTALDGAEMVFSLAARVSNIEFNRFNNFRMCLDNMLLTDNFFRAVEETEVPEALVMSTVCVYPHETGLPTTESEGGYRQPEDTNEGYGWAKLHIEHLARYAHEELGTRIMVVRPANLWGPRDHAEPHQSHVIPALIYRLLDGENPLVLWGTGTQRRTFLHVKDAAEGLLRIVDGWDDGGPVNLAHEREISILELAQLIVAVMGDMRLLDNAYIEIKTDTSKPDGHLRRLYDLTRMKSLTGGWVPPRTLKENLPEVVEEIRTAHFGGR